MRTRTVVGRATRPLRGNTIRLHPHFWLGAGIAVLVVVGVGAAGTAALAPVFAVASAVGAILTVTIGSLVVSRFKQPMGHRTERSEVDRRQTETALEGSSGELRALAAHLQHAREEERTAIARDLHDVLGQTMTVLKFDIASLRDGNKLPEGDIAALEARLDSAIAEVQRVAMALRPSALDHLGLVPAIEWHLQEFQRRTGVRCQLDVSGVDVALDERIATAAYRICQEALTNVMRHANALEVSVAIHLDDGRLVLAILDDGQGIDERSGDGHSLGLLGMRERARQVGGSLCVEPCTGGGTRVVFTGPLQAPHVE